MKFIDDIIKNEKSPILKVKYCETTSVQYDEAMAYAVTDVVRANIYDRIDTMGKLIGKELPEPEHVVIKGYQYSTGETANSYICNDIKFKSEDRFIGILLKKNVLDEVCTNSGAGHKIYEKVYLILKYPEEMEN